MKRLSPALKRLSLRATVSRVVAAALLCVTLQATGLAQSYIIRPTCKPHDQCKIKTATFGYNDTNWRQWPEQPRPDQTDPKTVGAKRLATPPAILEKSLPRAEVPAKPALPGGNLLPSGSGSMLLPGFGTDGGTATVPSGTPPGPAISVPAPVLHGLPDALGVPDTAPKPDGGGKSVAPPIELPGGPPPEKLTPDAPAAPAPKAPDKEVPAQPPPPDRAPSSSLKPDDSFAVPKLEEPSRVPKPDEPAAAPKPDEPARVPKLDEPAAAPKPDDPLPAKPIKGAALSQPASEAVATIQNYPPMQANWNAALEPEAVGDNQLRNTSFEKRTRVTGNPLRCGLEGYCPVELQDHDRWVAGSADFQASYQGQVFHFSSAAARQQFEAAPERYAPAQKGNDVVLSVQENRAVPGGVNHSAVWRHRLYLFSSAATLAAFRQDPARYVNGQRQTALQMPASSL